MVALKEWDGGCTSRGRASPSPVVGVWGITAGKFVKI